MSKQLAILETLLGAAELRGDRLLAGRIHQEIKDFRHLREPSGYRRLWSAAAVLKRPHRKAA
jgi:hypothetical protein